jgi:hypothetical protein
MRVSESLMGVVKVALMSAFGGKADAPPSPSNGLLIAEAVE